MEEKLLEEYFYRFGDYPPIHLEVDYEGEIYEKGIKESLESGKPLTLDRISELADEESIGRLQKDFDTKKIKDLLLSYGASEEAADQFIEDLFKGKSKEEKKQTKAEIYKAMREKGGSDLIIKLATMNAEDREKAIQEYLKD